MMFVDYCLILGLKKQLKYLIIC